MRRRRGGGGTPQSNNELRRHIEAAGKSYSTVEELVDRLRSSHPHYARHKLRPFTKQVEGVVMASSRSNDAMHDSYDEGDAPIVKKRRKIDGKEEKLQRNEAEHGRHRNGDVSSGGGGSSSSLASACSSEGGCSSYEEESTSEEFAPQSDLMKSIMREELLRKSKKLGESRALNKGLKEVNLMNDESRLGDNLNKNYRNDGSRGDANVIKRPMFKDLAGMSGVIEELKRRVIVPLCHPQLLPHYEVIPTAGILSLGPPAGVLLHGPPGCGKTRLAHAIANESGVPLHKVSATELVSGVSGASEENIRELFSKARRTSPSIVFIDEIDVIASKRDNSKRDMEKRIVTQLLTSMDPVEDEEGSESSDRRRGSVLVIGATNRPDDLDPALRRPGRFDREIMLGVPDEAARVEILSVVTCNLKVKSTLDLAKLARLTPGFVGADLRELAKEAASVALDRTLVKRKVELSKEQKDWVRQPWSVEEMENLFVTMDDFEEAVKRVQPSLRREGFSTIPNIKWDDVGGLHLLRQEFDRYIVRCIKLSKYFENYKGNLDPGFLLYGPPGCGKTSIAKAVANEAGANFIHIKGPELLNKYVGESESAVRSIFSRARTCSPCIIFFDEVHALTRKRGQEEGSVVERVLDQLLIELDGSEQRRGVYVIGATNSPEVMDDAVLRPGRFGRPMYVPLPTPDERGMILKALARELPIDADVDLVALGKDSRCDNFSGADLSCLIHEAMMAAVDDQLPSRAIEPWAIKRVNFTTALEKITPSVSAKQIRHYKRLSKRFKAK